MNGAWQTVASSGRLLQRDFGVYLAATLLFFAGPYLPSMALAALCTALSLSWWVSFWSQTILGFLCFFLTGPLWLGLCRMALASARGRTPAMADFLPNIAQASAAFTLAVLLGMSAGAASLAIAVPVYIESMTLLETALHSGRPAVFVVVSSLGGGLVLLPVCAAVIVAAPAFFAICDGSANPLRALRIGWRMAFAAPRGWLALWGALSLVHLAGIVCCCVGLLAATPWTAIALAMEYERQRVAAR